MNSAKCPNCSNNRIDEFFGIKNAPVFSIVTMRTRKEALEVPRKDIRLGFCNHCGFIFNTIFDDSIDYFALGYEDQQGFSKTFMSYLERISSELIEKYNLKGKKLLEIGCGKGDFINLLTELAGGIGIGIDPAYEVGRQNNPNLTFYKEYYSKKHGQLSADFICCRHTLEHIHQTDDFLRLIRSSIGPNEKPILFFEVPQVHRIMDANAFWDIYYEHCSYFSAGSIGHLFRNTGFEILDMRFDYNDQYLLIEAIPTEFSSRKTMAIEESVDELKKSADRFKISIEKELSKWGEQLTLMKRNGKKIVIWGGGSKSVGFLTNFADLESIEFVVDINPNMQQNFIPGIGCQYVKPQFLKRYEPDVVIIMNNIYKEEIEKCIYEMDIFPEIYIL